MTKCWEILWLAFSDFWETSLETQKYVFLEDISVLNHLWKHCVISQLLASMSCVFRAQHFMLSFTSYLAEINLSQRPVLPANHLKCFDWTVTCLKWHISRFFSCTHICSSLPVCKHLFFSFFAVFTLSRPLFDSSFLVTHSWQWFREKTRWVSVPHWALPDEGVVWHSTNTLKYHTPLTSTYTHLTHTPIFCF